MSSDKGSTRTQLGALRLEDNTQTRYTGRKKSKSLRATAKPRYEPLSALRTGQPVTLFVDLPASGSPMKRVPGAPTKRAVVITPRPWPGAPRDVVLVSVVGKGSAFVEVTAEPKIASLVLAGLPSRLATVLMDQLHRVLIWRST